MRILLISILLLSYLISCKEKPETPAEQPAATEAAYDTMAVKQLVKDFYTFYGTFMLKGDGIKFVDHSGEHDTLITELLDAYLAEFTKTGLVSEEFVANEKLFYERCEALWQAESKDEVTSGMDADKYLCAQDYDIAAYILGTSTVTFKTADEAILNLELYKETDHPMTLPIRVKKENSRWVITDIVCDMGVQ